MRKIIKHKNDLDTNIILIDNIVDDEKIFKYLEEMDDFESGELFSPRLQKWYQINGEYFCKKWKNQSYERWKSKLYDNVLLSIQKIIQKKVNEYVNVEFNSCLINKYRNGQDYIKPHRDSIYSFGEYPIIANLSIGEERIIKFEGHSNFDIKLTNGSLLIMYGSSQKYFKHSILKNNSNNIRYSLTFRHYLS